MPWYKLVNCGLIVVVCGGCQEVVDMYFHTQLGARREPPADTNASCQALLWAGLDFPKIIICVIKIIINNIFVINMIIIFSSKASTEQALFKLKSVEFWKKTSSSLPHSCCSSFSALIWTSVQWWWAISCRLRRLCRFGCRRHHHYYHHNHPRNHSLCQGFYCHT